MSRNENVLTGLVVTCSWASDKVLLLSNLKSALGGVGPEKDICNYMYNQFHSSINRTDSSIENDFTDPLLNLTAKLCIF